MLNFKCSSLNTEAKICDKLHPSLILYGLFSFKYQTIICVLKSETHYCCVLQLWCSTVKQSQRAGLSRLMVCYEIWPPSEFMCMNYVPYQLKWSFGEQVTSVFDVSRNWGASVSKSRGLSPMRSDLRALKGMAETGPDCDWDMEWERGMEGDRRWER